MTINKKIILFLFVLSFFSLVKGQSTQEVLQVNTITTAVPFITINSNAQSMGSGWIGVVTSDINSQNGLDQNPAMLSRGKKIIGFQFLNYVPWMRKLHPDINLYETGYYHSIDNNNALGFSARYFSLGKTFYTDQVGNALGSSRPNESMFSLKYAHNFSEYFSMGTALKYISSNLTSGSYETKTANAFAGDLGFDYRRNLLQTDNFKLRWNVGFALLNIGTKVSYTNNSDKDFLPQTMKLGTLFTLRWKILNNNYVACDFSYQADKLLVPTPPVLALDSNGFLIPDNNGYFKIEAGMNPNVSVLQGMVQSFYDAPGGSTEEMREIIHQYGAETRISCADNRILAAIRAGYFNEHASKGNRKFTTLGIGFGFAGFRLDISYLITKQQLHPLKNTISVSLGARFYLDKDTFFRFKEQ